MKAEPVYLAITGDLRHSRRVESRDALQDRLLSAVASLNRKYRKPKFAARLTMTAGDAVQCLLNDFGIAVPVMDALSDAARPLEFTFGLGLGPVSTKLHENVALIDGPAFHNSVEALEHARSDDAWAAASGFGADDDRITALTYLMGAVRRRWTDRQVEFLQRLDSAPTQTELAREMGVSPSVVSESLKSASAQQYRFAASVLADLLDSYAQKSG